MYSRVSLDLLSTNQYTERKDDKMIYTPLTKKALKISFNAHKDQVDKSGMPYVYHPFHLAEQMNDENSTCVALLHDVVEDTYVSLDDLASEGFPMEVIEALTLMTHDDNVSYMDYVRKIKTNPIATKVKLADLEHNSDLTRLELVDDAALERADKYRRAIILLRYGEASKSPTKIIRASVARGYEIQILMNASYRQFIAS